MGLQNKTDIFFQKSPFFNLFHTFSVWNEEINDFLLYCYAIRTLRNSKRSAVHSDQSMLSFLYPHLMSTIRMYGMVVKEPSRKQKP